ncbi:Gfo/Idh/MocA family protein [Oceanibaculum pacificum]|uniref:Dehydrogenase n=1 Tax=Oceanibaculum pacificum TaxID=580166 RepID=A0A154WFC1_9PROT|nr:Gfo/Idh/MocA family oxidoreductase [Oceanibaculum pacificum]KZD12210.1 hypothetical protein AUP43_05235 [Oceanibaculum pacificum]
MDDKPHILVCGAGSIGRRHIANLQRLGAPVIAWRERAELVGDLAREFGIDTVTNFEPALDAARAIVVATATDRHMPLALAAMRRGKPLFLEKPVSHDREDVDSLERLAAGQIVEIGCQLRAHPNLARLRRELGDGAVAGYRLAMGQRLDEWRPGSDYRAGYSAQSARGGGALSDLIHQIDLALWLFGPVRQVAAMLDRRGPLEIAGDDFSNLLLRHDSGVVGHIQLDMLAPAYRGEAEIVTADHIYRWSLRDGVLSRAQGDNVDVIDSTPETFQRNDLFLSHMRHFLARLDDPALPALCSLADGISALDIVLAARRSQAENRFVTLEKP